MLSPMISATWQPLPGPQHELAEEPTLDAAHHRLVWVDVPRGEIWARAIDDPSASPAGLLHRIEAPISAARPDGDGLVVASRMTVLRLRERKQTTISPPRTGWLSRA